MILSMTGYGQSTKQIGNKNYRFEIKSLNGKTSDIRFKSTLNLRDKEIELRQLINERGMRGKFDVTLITESANAEEDFSINKPLMTAYFNELKTFADSNGIGYGDIIQSLVRLPNIIQLTEGEITDADWNEMTEMVEAALTQLNNFRRKEGASLETDVLEKVDNIMNLLNDVDKYEGDRIEHLKERIHKNLLQYLAKENVDKNRFEQEVIYYLEKLDINEEKVRLKQHCLYFEEEVKRSHVLKGKKLSFITQEIGREINTLGAKAQHPDIQQIVVQMKDDLEKIKEQVLNIL